MSSKTSVSTSAFLATASAAIIVMWLSLHFSGIPKNNPGLPLSLIAVASTSLGSLWLAWTKAPSSARSGQSHPENPAGSSDDAVFGVNLEGFIVSWNAAAERLSGYTAGEIIGQHLSVMLIPGARPEQAARLVEVCRGKEVSSEVTCVGKDGCKMELHACPNPFSCDYDHGLL